MTSAVQVRDRVATDGSLGSVGAADVAVIAGVTLLGSLTLHRRTA